MLDLDTAMASPASVFTTPDDLVEEGALTRDQKIQALRQWHYDLRELQVATEENMGGEDEGGATLESVKAALRRLEAETDGDAPVPTSHGS
jgi:hypothetical protein